MILPMITFFFFQKLSKPLNIRIPKVAYKILQVQRLQKTTNKQFHCLQNGIVGGLKPFQKYSSTESTGTQNGLVLNK